MPRRKRSTLPAPARPMRWSRRSRNLTSFSSPWARAWDGHDVVDLAVFAHKAADDGLITGRVNSPFFLIFGAGRMLYSLLNAIAGSTRVARTAGIPHAAIATTTRVATARSEEMSNVPTP